MIPHTPFIFLRHGETDWNKQNIAMGQQDIPLNETGLKQAHKAAEILKNVPIGSIISSTLTRAEQTAEIISSHLEIGYQTDHGLREFSLGVLEGKSTVDLAQFQDLRSGAYVEGAERYTHFSQRIISAVNRALQAPHPVLIISHAGVYWPIQDTLSLPAFALPNCHPVFHRPPETTDTPWFVYPVEEEDKPE